MYLETLKRIKQNPLYAKIISYLVHKADRADDIRACYIIGSLAQKNSHPTPYSDLDVELVVKRKEEFTQNLDWIEDIQKKEFSYLQKPSDGNGEEIRVLFSEHMKSVDFTFLTLEEFKKCYSNKQYLNGVFGRGVVPLIDKDGIIERLAIEKTNTLPPLNKETFNMTYKNVIFHLIYAKNKILAGELLTAKNTIDVSIRESLMKFIRWEENLRNPEKDLWHRARHFEKWADEDHKLLIENASPTYSKDDMEKSLLLINQHIMKIAKNISKQTGISLEYNRDISDYLVGHTHAINLSLARKNEYV